MSTRVDYYELLEVSRSASGEEIQKAYRRLAIRYHPDKNPGDHSAEEKFKQIGEAYEILSDGDKRAAYDRYGHAAFQNAGARGGGFHDPMDIFREMFRGSGFEEMFGGGGGPGRGGDLRYDLELTLEEAAAGLEKEIKYRRAVACPDCAGSGAEKGSKKQTCPMCRGAGQVVRSMGGFIRMQQICPQCHGRGEIIAHPCHHCGGEGRIEEMSKLKITVPPGVDSGQRLRSQAGGEAGALGGPPGDLYIFIHVREHDIFQRDGDDLHCTIPIKFTLAALGGSLHVPTLTGKADLKIPAGTQSGTQLRLRGRGMPSLRGGGSGDQYVRIEIEVPKKLTAEQRQKLEDYGRASGDAERPVSESFFEKAKRFFEM